MAKKFKDLVAKMSPESRERARLKADVMLEQIRVSELRKAAGLTQAQLSVILGVTQPNIAKMEKKADMQVSSLIRIVEKLGGRLEIVAHLPKVDVQLTQFT
jgi:transcriptional regulator